MGLEFTAERALRSLDELDPFTGLVVDIGFSAQRPSENQRAVVVARERSQLLVPFHMYKPIALGGTRAGGPSLAVDLWRWVIAGV